MPLDSKSQVSLALTTSLFFEDFTGGERNWPVRVGFVAGFARFKKRHNNCVFPVGWDAAVYEESVEDYR